MRIQSNTSALRARNSYSKINGELAKTLEKLSSGYCINRAADNAAGLAVSEKMRYMITGLDQGEMNIQDGVSYVQVAEGALFEIEDMLNRSKELTEQAMNGTYTDAERESINDEIQQIKSEMDRIINSTTFNGLQIWGNDNCSQEVIGYIQKQAVSFSSTSNSFTITEENKKYVPNPNINLNADKDGISFSWKAFDGNNYVTEVKPWPNPVTSSQPDLSLDDFKIYKIDENSGDKVEANPQPYLPYGFGYQVAEGATLDDVITCINGSYSVSQSINQTASGTNATGSGVSGISYAANIYYDAQLALEKHMSDYDSGFIEPTVTVDNPSNITHPNYSDSNGTWTIDFQLDNAVDANGNPIKIQAQVSSVGYRGKTTDEQYKGIYWGQYTTGGIYDLWQKADNSNVGGVLDAYKTISDDALDGRIKIVFDLKCLSEIKGIDNKPLSETIGDLTIYFNTSSQDVTEDTIREAVKNSLGTLSVVDIANGNMYGSNGYANTTVSVVSTYANDNMIDSPQYRAIYDVIIQGGLQDVDQIHIQYDQLSVEFMGMKNASALTVYDAERTFKSIEGALSMVVSQHGQFGAYTNRLEHAANANSNTHENLQAAEARIRDTDMAKEFSKFTQKNILLQAAQSMLAQANQQPQAVLSLLQA